MIRTISAILAICVWGTLCIKVIADPIMSRVLASGLSLNQAFAATWFVATLVIFVMLAGAWLILKFAGSTKWVR